MKKKLSDLYQGVILTHSKQPFRFSKNETAQHILEAYNPFCGDKFKLYLNIKNDRIEMLSFHGYGCAISKASTSILVEQLLGKTIAEAKKMCRQFMATIHDEIEPTGVPADFLAFRAARDFPSRIKCADLSWTEMVKFLEKKV